MLGADYLRTLSTILLYLHCLHKEFEWGGRCVFWRGLGTPHMEASVAHIHLVTANPDRPFINDLLREYDNVFVEPHVLPTSRPYDQWIHLLQGTAPMAVRPYRYPLLQKVTLER